MGVSISKRVMPLFGLLCAGVLMCASALFCPNAALAQSGEASGSARIYILPFEYMDAILIESDGHFEWSIPTAQWRLVGAKSMASGISSITAERCRRAGTTMVRLGIGLALTALWRWDGVLSRGRGIASAHRAS